MKQHAFIKTISAALGRDQISRKANIFSTSPSGGEEHILQVIRNRSALQREGLLAQMREFARPLRVDVHEHQSLQEAATAIAELIAEKSPEWGSEKQVCRWDHPLLNALELESMPMLQDIPIITAPVGDKESQAISSEQKEAFRHEVEKSFVGITSADYCAAATATIALRSRPGHARAVSLVPSIHVAVIEEEKLLANLEELYTLLKWDPKEREEGLTNNLSLISGPSKTGDIELIMVHGAHGPRELHLFVLRKGEAASCWSEIVNL